MQRRGLQPSGTKHVSEIPQAAKPKPERLDVDSSDAERALAGVGDQLRAWEGGDDGDGHRWPVASGLTRNIETLVFLLDNALRVPGTSFRLGLDPVLGLIPGIGDAIGGVLSLSVVFLALQYRLPVSVVAIMVRNIAVDVGVGAVPGVGDVMDFAWRANRKNLALLRQHQAGTQLERPPRHSRFVLLLLVLAAIICIAIPIALSAWLVWSFFHR